MQLSQRRLAFFSSYYPLGGLESAMNLEFISIAVWSQNKTVLAQVTNAHWITQAMWFGPPVALRDPYFSATNLRSHPPR